MRGVAALVAFVALTILVAVGALDRIDRAIFDIFKMPHSAWLDFGASLVSGFAKSEVVGSVALGVAIVRLRARRRDWWITLLVALVVVVEIVLKAIVHQAPPPDDLTPNVDVLPFLDSPMVFSFPSGHIARVTFMVVALRWPGWISAAIVLAMALARLYLGGHWPSDIVGGWLLGYGIAASADRRP